MDLNNYINDPNLGALDAYREDHSFAISLKSGEACRVNAYPGI